MSLKMRQFNCTAGIAEEPAGRSAKVIAVTSGKGGVGKTNVAANLGISMASLQNKVVLLDADMSLGNLDIVMGLNSRHNISEVLSGRRTIEQITEIGPEGIGVICGGSGLEELADLSTFHRYRLLDELSRLESEYDTIIIDTAAGISRSVIGFCLASDQTLVVTTPEATALTDAYAMVKVLASQNYTGRISVIVNMAENLSEGRHTYRQFASTAQRFLNTHLYDAGVILRDSRVSDAVRLRKPVIQAYPKSQASLALNVIARRLSSSFSNEYMDRTFFRKVVDFFT